MFLKTHHITSASGGKAKLHPALLDALGFGARLDALEVQLVRHLGCLGQRLRRHVLL